MQAPRPFPRRLPGDEARAADTDGRLRIGCSRDAPSRHQQILRSVGHQAAKRDLVIAASDREPPPDAAEQAVCRSTGQPFTPDAVGETARRFDVINRQT